MVEKHHAGTLLIVDDDELYRLGLSDRFSPKGYRVLEATSCAEMRKKLKQHEVDVMLLDIHLPDGNGIDILDEIKRVNDFTEVIMITAHASFEKASEARKRGAWHFVAKDFSLQDLERIVDWAQKYVQVKKDAVLSHAREMEIERARQVMIVGKSKKMLDCLEMAERLAESDKKVLILGETGTGKEVLARYIHAKSRRKGGPFVAINCTNLSESLLEDELFGHVAGAFTGADKLKYGKVELAQRGTLFLDEIGEISLGLQVKFLRFLETNKFYRVGGTEEMIADVRIIAATNRDLQNDISKGTFREDLFYRLNAMQITLPPLRERLEDIPELSDHFISEHKHVTRTTLDYQLTPEAMKGLMEYHWPGNIRELKNVIDRGIQFCQDGVITNKALGMCGISPLHFSDRTQKRSSGTYRERLDSQMRDILLSVLEESAGNRTKAAEILGLSRAGLHKIMRRLGISEE